MDIRINTEKKRLLITYAVIWLVCSLLLYLSVRLLIISVGGIVGLIDSSLSDIFSAWRRASVDTPIWLILLLGATFASAAYFGFSVATKKDGGKRASIRVLTVIVLILIFLASFALTLWLTKINSIPVYVLAEIVPDLVGAL